jgi:hypothetical protein
MVTPISNGSGRVTAPPPLKPEDAFKKVDVANKGYVTEAELASAIVQLSPEGISLAQADAQSLAKEAFTKLDADRDGKVTLGEFKAAAPGMGPMTVHPRARGPGRPGCRRPVVVPAHPQAPRGPAAPVPPRNTTRPTPTRTER